MSQIHKMIAEVRVYLDEPNHQHPSERHLFTILSHNLQNFSNELQNTGQNWNIASWQLDAIPGTDQYPIAPSDFGKPIYILTKSTNPNVEEREIPIVDPQNFNFLRSHYAGGWGEDHSAAAIAFYGQGAMAAGHVCKIVPTPTKAASYTIWYKTGLLPDLALADDLLVPEHHQLLVTRTALAAIPYCRWWPTDDKPDLMMAKAQALQNSIGFMNSMYEETYMKYKSNLRQESMASRVLFGESDW